VLLLYIVADRISIGKATKKYNKIHKVTRADGGQADNAQSERENLAAAAPSLSKAANRRQKSRHISRIPTPSAFIIPPAAAWTR